MVPYGKHVHIDRYNTSKSISFHQNQYLQISHVSYRYATRYRRYLVEPFIHNIYFIRDFTWYQV